MAEDLHRSTGRRTPPRVFALLALVMLALLVHLPTASADRQIGLQFAELVSTGTVDVKGEFEGLRLRSGGAASLKGHAGTLHLVTINDTYRSVLGTTVDPVRGGADETITNAELTALSSGSQVDLVIVPLGGPIRMLAQVDRVAATLGQGKLEETAYVEASRELISRDMASTLSVPVTGVHALRIEGDFLVAIWDWNFTVNQHLISTGAHASNAVGDPVTGTEVAADYHEQVAKLEVKDGFIELRQATSADLYGGYLTFDVEGNSVASGLSGPLPTTSTKNVVDSRLVLEGKHVLEVAPAANRPFMNILESARAILDGKDVKLLPQPPARPGTVLAEPQRTNWYWGASASIVAILVASVFLHGSLRTLRFRRIQRRFDERDYIAVLEIIDPFTRRRRFRRRAAFLKAISLLSLESFREAALYLDTLDARHGPDPATRAFLQACAAAGQGEDSAAIEHLTTCFKLDPSYLEEARALPILSGLLPFFELTGQGAGA